MGSGEDACEVGDILLTAGAVDLLSRLLGRVSGQSQDIVECRFALSIHFALVNLDFSSGNRLA